MCPSLFDCSRTLGGRAHETLKPCAGNPQLSLRFGARRLLSCPRHKGSGRLPPVHGGWPTEVRVQRRRDRVRTGRRCRTASPPNTALLGCPERTTDEFASVGKMAGRYGVQRAEVSASYSPPGPEASALRSCSPARNYPL